MALGGGTGLPVVLRGLVARLGQRLETSPEALVGVVTVTDDGGSSGRLRRSRGVFPPGDIRNCLVAMARDPHSLAELFQHRYGDGGRADGLEGHALGNLILTALVEKTGCPLQAIARASRVLDVRGRLLPSTLSDVSLVAEMGDGSTVHGESRITSDSRPIARIRLDPESPPAAPSVLEAIARADLVVLSPGSLFTSLVPVLLVRGVAEALRRSEATRVLVGNLMTQPGETDGFDGEAHLRVVERQLGPGALDVVLASADRPDGPTLARYRGQGQVPVAWSEEAVRRHGAVLVTRPLVADSPKARHAPEALADGLLDLIRTRAICRVGV